MNHRLLLVLVVFGCSLSVPVSAQTPRYARVISANASLRDTPSIAGGSEQEVAEGTLVKVLDEKLLWYVVLSPERISGDKPRRNLSMIQLPNCADHRCASVGCSQLAANLIPRTERRLGNFGHLV